MLWFLYNIVFVVGYLLMMPRFVYRMWRRGGYRAHFLERVGRYDRETRRKLAMPGRIWIHAVSVGEIDVALRFIRGMRAHGPDRAFVVTVTTSTGHRIAESQLDPRDVLIYFPSDFPFIVRRVLRLIRPRALILTESELWPNLIRCASMLKVPTILLNGRISESSYRGYRKARFVFKHVVRRFNLMLVQSEQDRWRLVNLGANPERVKVVGTAKYDLMDDDPAVYGGAEAILAACGIAGDDPILVGGSTWPGEEAVLLDIYGRLKALHPSLKLVLAPRHAERCADVETEIKKRGRVWRRRSEVGGSASGPAPRPDVLLVDTTGELKKFYACATAIFVGKSLIRHGGQNLIEPAIFRKPIVVGPHMENFEAVAADFLQAQAMIQVSDAQGLEEAFRSLLADSKRREGYGQRAFDLVLSRKGVIQESVKRVDEALAGTGDSSAIGLGSQPTAQRQE